MFYFAVEIFKGQRNPYCLEEVGTYLDYYIVSVSEDLFVYIDFDELNPIPLTEDEAKAYWFAGAYHDYIKVPENRWEDFGRELNPEYKRTVKGKIVYPITQEDDGNATSLMKKILHRKIVKYFENIKIFDLYDELHYNLEKSFFKQLEQANNIKETNLVYYRMQEELYKEKR